MSQYLDVDDQTNQHFTYDKMGRLISEPLPGNNTASTIINWRQSDSKVASYVRLDYTLEFTYDAFGRRIKKTKKPANSLTDPTTWTQTYYSYDANGQLMAVYNLEWSANHGNPVYSTATLSEHHVYGASRLGIVEQQTVVFDDNVLSTPGQAIFSHEVGEYRYEVTNHLGNVNAVVTDNKQWNTTGSYYEAEIVLKVDYYPYGMEMPGRNVTTDDYRFAYNGMEADNDVRGDGNSYTTEFRQYDPRLGRWLSLDPLMSQFPWMSPYVAFDDNPVFYVDPFGLSSTSQASDGGPEEGGGAGDKTKRVYNLPKWGLGTQKEFEDKLPSDGVNKGDSFHINLSGASRPGDLTSVNYTYLGKGPEGIGQWRRTAYLYNSKTPSITTINGNKSVNGNSSVLAALGTPSSVSTSTVSSSGGVGGTANTKGGGFTPSGVTVGGGQATSAGIQNTVNTPTPENSKILDVSKEIGGTLLDGAGDAASTVLIKRSVYGAMDAAREVTVRTPVVNVNTTVKTLKAAKVAAKAAGVVNFVATVYDVGSEFGAGRTKAATAKIAVFGLQAACMFIPGPGWIVAGLIGIADAIWGDDFYNWLEK